MGAAIPTVLHLHEASIGLPIQTVASQTCSRTAKYGFGGVVASAEMEVLL
jgi:hypothetical protein